MTRGEWLEWLIPIAIIVAFWPVIFSSVPGWYIYAWSGFSVIAMAWILYRRISRYREDLHNAREMMKMQREMPPGYPPGPAPEDDSAEES
jgi:hypothetical protein